MKKLIVLTLVLFSISIASAQTEVAGVNLPDTESFGNETLSLNGAGVREKFWMDMYAGGLYLQEKSSDATEIMKSDKPMAIKLHIVSKLITSKRMIDAVNEGFQNSTHENTEPIKAKIKQFISFFSDPIQKDDVFDIVYLPTEGVVVYKNRTEKGTITGLEFKEALFGIWLSDEPADEDLKQAMLGIQE